MKKLFLKTYDKLLLVLMGAFPFFTGCEDPNVEYGSPYADFNLSGLVIDSISSNPLPGIQVTVKSWKGTTLLVTETKTNGYYSFVFQDFPDYEKVFSINVEDLDGILNGGEFASEKADIKVIQSEYEIDGENNTNFWYSGVVYKRKDFRMNLK
jgi:putative lipoprotein (rSAM/lipoprotein system)